MPGSGWFAALGRLALFGALFVLFADLLGLLLRPLAAGGGGAIALGGTAWLIAAVVAGVLMLRFADGRSWRALGFSPRWRALPDLAAGLGFGALLLFVAVAPLVLTGLVAFRPELAGEAVASTAGESRGGAAWFTTVGTGLLVLAPPAAAEEALFRGYPFQVLARAGGAPFAVVTTSAAFAALHGANPEVGWIALANIALAGVWLALVYLRTESLWAASAAHLGWNWTMAVLLDLPVSGLNWIDTPVYDAVVRDPAWLTGGAFGPEGGVLATLALLAGIVALRRMRGRPAPERERPLHAPPAPTEDESNEADGMG